MGKVVTREREVGEGRGKILLQAVSGQNADLPCVYVTERDCEGLVAE